MTSSDSDAMMNAILELRKAVDSLSKAIDSSNKRNVDDREGIEAEKTWEAVRDKMAGEGKETVESWKDELDNLLVFAGLFSAVVTPFTIESYKWLLQDPVETSNTLLAQISLQLSQFTIAPVLANSTSPLLVNSTFPALSVSDVEMSPSPVSSAATINVLWFCSLTLSLISAFFAITVQQWLRQLRVPPAVPLRRAIQLLVSHSVGLRTWKVQSIVTLLPLVVQIAVCVFLFGLFLLLKQLNLTVSTVFEVLSLTGIMLYVLGIMLSFQHPQCPYKSPVVSTIPYMVYLLLLPLYLPILLLSPILLRYPRFDALARRALRLLPGSDEFWLSREYQFMLEDNGEYGTILERSALIQHLLSIPFVTWPKQSFRLMRDVDYPALHMFQGTVESTLQIFQSGLKWTDIMKSYVLDSTMTRSRLRTQPQPLLWRLLLERDWDSQDHRKVTDADSKCLLFYHELDRAFFLEATQPSYAKHLVHICANQELTGAWMVYEAVPAVLLLDLITSRRYVLEQEELLMLRSFASKVHQQYHDPFNKQYASLMLLMATVFVVLAPHAYPGEINVTAGIADILDNQETQSRLGQMLRRHYGAKDINRLSRCRGLLKALPSWTQRFWIPTAVPEFMSPAALVAALCRALACYAWENTLPLDSSHLKALVHISVVLRRLCGRQEYTKKSIMQKACRLLDVFSSVAIAHRVCISAPPDAVPLARRNTKAIDVDELQDTLSRKPQQCAQYLLDTLRQRSPDIALSDIVSAYLLFDLSSNREYTPDGDAVSTIRSLASAICEQYGGRLDEEDAFQLFVMAATLALIDPGSQTNVIPRPLASLLNGAGTENIENMLRRSRADANRLLELPEFMSTPNVVTAFCGALAGYVSTSPLALNQHIEALNNMAKSLKSVCDELISSGTIKLREARRHLDEIVDRLPAPASSTTLIPDGSSHN